MEALRVLKTIKGDASPFCPVNFTTLTVAGVRPQYTFEACSGQHRFVAQLQALLDETASGETTFAISRVEASSISSDAESAELNMITLSVGRYVWHGGSNRENHPG